MRNTYISFCLSFLLFGSTFGFAAVDQAAKKVVVLECKSLLAGMTEPSEVKIQAGTETFQMILPSVLNEPISNVTYSLGFILKGLGFKKADLAATFGGKKVLLVGESFGVLLPELLKAGADVVAVDPLYVVKDQTWDLSQVQDRPDVLKTAANIQAYFKKYGKHLIAGTGTNLSFLKAEFDYVISFKVINNFVKNRDTEPEYDFDLIRKFLLESTTVLKVGGKAMHAFEGNDEAYDFFFGAEGVLGKDLQTGFKKSASKPYETFMKYSPSNAAYKSLNGEKNESTPVHITIQREE